jgi:pimeloyl-ACP methyl ester carboxylesterase
MNSKLFLMAVAVIAAFGIAMVVTPVLAQNMTAGNATGGNVTGGSMTAMAQQQPTLEGISFDIDNMTFSHNTASVNGIQLHYVIGGQGDPVVLLHGWPETWYAWHRVMPALAKNYTVIAPDLRGLGDSSKPVTGYDGKTLAEDIHQLVTQLGFKTIFLVGHDIGSFVVYPYAAAHPTEVKRLVVMDVPPPGFFPPPQVNGGPPLWWILFHQTPDVPEALTQGKEMEYLSWHYQNLAYNRAAITQEAINEYVSRYSAPGGMRAGFEHYRAMPQDAIQNQNYSKTMLTMPVLALAGGYIPTFGGNTTMPCRIWDEAISSKCNRDHSSKFRTLYCRRAAGCRSKTT